MFDFRLKVFYVVAKRLNFTKAADELFISQPAVSKHIREIEAYYKTKMFERNGTKIKLTEAGRILYMRLDELATVYRNIDHDIAALNNKVKGVLNIGVSTTVANYVLPKYLSSFKQKYPDVKISLTTHNTENIENLLSEGKIDVGIVEGRSKRSYLKYTCLIKDEIVLCTRMDNPLAKKQVVDLNDIIKLPLVLREPGSGSLEVIQTALKKRGINLSQLNIDMELESTESIKCYLLNSDSFAFLSLHSIFDLLKNRELKVLDIKGLEMDRCFYFITQQGDTHPLHELFFKHLSSHNLKL